MAKRVTKPTLSANDRIARDEFARIILPVAVREFYSDGEAWSDHDDLARHVYSIADAMVRASNKE